MFQGFTDQTFEFYMAIRFNNNRDFYLENKDWYQSAVRQPMALLCETLANTVSRIDPGLETRPGRCIARINRDTRFSRDKSPYRDYSFLKFRHPQADRDETLGFYFALSDDGAQYGMGIYGKNLPMMRRLSQAIDTRPREVQEAIAPLEGKFAFYPDTIKRMKIPQETPKNLVPWYPLRGFYIERELTDFALIKSPELADEVAQSFLLAAPLYKLLTQTDEKEIV